VAPLLDSQKCFEIAWIYQPQKYNNFGFNY